MNPSDLYRLEQRYKAIKDKLDNGTYHSVAEVKQDHAKYVRLRDAIKEIRQSEGIAE